MKFSFSLIDQVHKKIIYQWLEKKHVREYFHGKGLQNTLHDLNQFLEKKPSIHQHWIAYFNSIPMGYLMTSSIDPEEKDFQKWVEPSEKAITLDLLIGEEEFLGKGLATLLIQSFIKSECTGIDIIMIDPEVANTKAIHVYEKAGFQKLETFIASWHPVPHFRMRLYTKSLK